MIQDFFQAAESQGIKMSTIERGIKQLRAVISLYRETTGSFILSSYFYGRRPTLWLITSVAGFTVLEMGGGIEKMAFFCLEYNALKISIFLSIFS